MNYVWEFFSGGFILSATLGQLLDTCGEKGTTGERCSLKPCQKGWILGQWPSPWLFIWCKVRVESSLIRIYAFIYLLLLKDRLLHFVVKRICWHLDLVNCSNKCDGFQCVKCYVSVWRDLRGASRSLESFIFALKSSHMQMFLSFN